MPDFRTASRGDVYYRLGRGASALLAAGFFAPAALARTPRNAAAFTPGNAKKILSRIVQNQREFTDQIARFRGLIKSKRICTNVHSKE
jgi:hypothetical protein